MDAGRRVPWLTELLVELAREAGLAVDVEPEWGYAGRLSTPDGRATCFVGTTLDINPAGASALVADKAFAARFIARLGFPVPKGEAFFSDPWCRFVESERDVEWACRYAARIGFPVVVKPNSRSAGAGVAKARNPDELREAAAAVFSLAQDRVAVVQEFLDGEEYRVLLFDGDLIAAYRRTRQAVTGDGRRTAAELLHDSAVRGVDAAHRAERTLRRAGIDLDQPLAEGLRVELLDSANLSTGGTAEDVTHRLAPEFAAHLARLAAALNLRLCAVDLIVRGPIDRVPQTYWILEINAAPQATGYAAIGERQRQGVIQLYERIFAALIAK